MTKNVKKTRAVLAAVCLFAIFFIMMGSCGRKNDETRTIIRPTVGDIQSVVSTTGEVQPQNRLEIKPPIAGRIEEIQVVEGQEVKTGNVLALMSSTERAALLDGARLQGEEEVAYWKTVYNATPLIAPIDGLVIVRSVEPGQTVTTSDAIIVLSDRLIVEADVDETDIGSVAVGQKASVSLDAYPGISVAATVNHISYESELVNNVTIYKVDILPEEVPDVFRSGMSANVDIVVKQKSGAVLLPFEAVENQDGRNVVTVWNSSKREEMAVAVETGIQDEETIEIVTGISAEDQVVVKKTKYQSLLNEKTGSNPFMPSRNKKKEAK